MQARRVRRRVWEGRTRVSGTQRPRSCICLCTQGSLTASTGPPEAPLLLELHRGQSAVAQLRPRMRSPWADVGEHTSRATW